MRINRILHRQLSPDPYIRLHHQSGVTLIELITFIVVVSIGLGTLFSVFNHAMVNSVDPVIRVRALECAQAKLDEIIARKFDENTPTGGIPACGSAETGAGPCAGIATGADLDDVGDYDGQNFTNGDCNVNVSVTSSGAPNQVRLITVTSVMPDGSAVVLSTYRTNF